MDAITTSIETVAKAAVKSANKEMYAEMITALKQLVHDDAFVNSVAASLGLSPTTSKSKRYNNNNIPYLYRITFSVKVLLLSLRVLLILNAVFCSSLESEKSLHTPSTDLKMFVLGSTNALGL